MTLPSHPIPACRRVSAGPSGRRVLAAVLASALLAALSCPDSQARSATTGKSGEPIEILADEALEWRREDQQYVAQGNAVAIQGQNRVYADRLVASYRSSGKATNSDFSDSDIYRIEAIGHVRVVLPGQTITGSRAVRETDSGVIWIVGSPPTLKTRTEVVTASERLEYRERTRTAVAIGDATARDLESGHSIRADLLEADLGGEETTGHKDDSGIREIRATGNVVIETDAETITGDHGVYRPATGVATLEGNVLLVSDDGRQVTGNRAEVNIKTGVSRITRGDAVPGGGETSGQVRAIFETGDKK